MKYTSIKQASITVTFSTDTISEAVKEFADVLELARFLKSEPELAKKLKYLAK